MPWSWEVGPEPVAMPGVQSMAGESASEDAPGRDKDGTLSVSEAVNLVKGKVKSLPTLVVTGEVTGFRGPNARSGHWTSRCGSTSTKSSISTCGTACRSR